MTTPMQRPMSDDEAAQFWLLMLRDGNVNEKNQAREHLAGIFERRRMLAEAVELLESNVTAGVNTPDVHDWLARLYSALGQPAMAQRAQESAATLRRQAKVAPVSVGWRGSVFSIIAFLLFCWPIGLIFLWTRAPWTRRTKTIITIAVLDVAIYGITSRALERAGHRDDVLQDVLAVAALLVLVALAVVVAFLVIRLVIRRLTAQRTDS